jgi:hypothetical protein
MRHKTFPSLRDALRRVHCRHTVTIPLKRDARHTILRFEIKTEKFCVRHNPFAFC